MLKADFPYQTNPPGHQETDQAGSHSDEVNVLTDWAEAGPARRTARNIIGARLVIGCPSNGKRN